MAEFSLFGIKILRKQDEEKRKESFVAKEEEDGALTIQATGVGSSSYSQYLDMDNSAKTEAELITRYRQLSLQPEIEYAVDEIVNEAVASDEHEVVSINLDRVDTKIIGEKTKKVIQDEFSKIVNMMNFNNVAYETFRRWVIDGRMYYHVIVDVNNKAEGILELRYIDPRKIKKVREVKEERKGKVVLKKTVSEYFVYNENGFAKKETPTSMDFGNMQGLKIETDSIIHCTSGLMDENNKLVYSYLHKAIRPMNMLRSLEDAVVIYRLSRAPERRVFYVDVGNLPKAKAEQHLNDVMTKFKNRLVYDQNTGAVKDDRRHMTMLEDFYLARRDGSRGTEISTLSGGQNLGEMSDVEYFLKKLYKALNIPVSRLEESTGFSIGRTSEITRDEVKFNKFISRLRRRFASVFLQALEKQLVMKEIITWEEWDKVRNDVSFKFAVDSHFTELKQMDIMMARLDVAERVDPMVGKYYSKEWVRKKVLMQTDEDIEEIDEQMDQEAEFEQEAMAEMEPPESEDPDEKPEAKPAPQPKAPPAQVLKIQHQVKQK